MYNQTRIRNPITTTRAVRVGAVMVMAAAAVLTTATPSYAAVPTLSQVKGPATGTNTITLSGGDFTGGASSGVQFNTAATCPATYTTPSTTIKTALNVVVNDADLDVVVPALTAATTYNICVYAAKVVASSALTDGTTTKPYTAVAAGTALSLSPTNGASTGGDTITLTDTSTAFGAGTAVEFATTCPTTYGAASATVLPGTSVVVTPGATTLNVNSPAGLTGTSYYVCVYTGNTVGTSTQITRTAAASFLVNKLNVTPAKGPIGGTNTITLSGANVTYAGSTAVEFNTGVCPSTYAAAAPASAAVAATSATVVGTTVTVVVPVLQAVTYNLCAYAGSVVGTSALTAGTSGEPYTAAAAGTLVLDPERETGGQGGMAITGTDTTMEYGAATTAEFQTAATCSAEYAAPTGGSVILATAEVSESDLNDLDIISPVLAPETYSVCVYTGNVVGTSVLMSKANAAFNEYGTLALSSYSGPSAGGASITITTTGNAFLSTTAVEFNPKTADDEVCVDTSGAADIVAVTTKRLLSTSKMAITVPAGVVVVGGNPTDYNVCTYNGGADC